MKYLFAPLAVAVLAALAMAPAAQAQDAGSWTFKFGLHTVEPKSNNGSVADGAFAVDVDSDLKPTIQAEYFFSPNLGVEVLAALPFKHEIRLNGAVAADVKQLPPTVSVQYHFNTDGKVRPFLGAGLNYTRFFGVDESGPLTGTQLNLDSSFGLALHAGIDFDLNDKWMLMIDARKIDIDTDVSLNGADIGSVAIDPLVFGASVGFRF